MEVYTLFFAFFVGFTSAKYLPVDQNVREFFVEDVISKTTRVGKYVFVNCGDSKTDVAVVKAVNFGPDPLSFPGPLRVNFSVALKESIDSPVQADVQLSRHTGTTWIPIPCIADIGSCHYKDICALLGRIQTCPQPFTDHNIPCHCPYKAGNYTLPETEFQVEVPVFPSGDYHINANVKYGGKRAACLDIHASFT